MHCLTHHESEAYLHRTRAWSEVMGSDEDAKRFTTSVPEARPAHSAVLRYADGQGTHSPVRSIAPDQVGWLARRLLSWLAQSSLDEVLVYVRDTISDDYGDFSLLSVLRSAHGEHRPLSLAPGHVLQSHEHDHARSLIHLAICGSWDAWVCTRSSPNLAFIHYHHDIVLYSSICGEHGEYFKGEAQAELGRHGQITIQPLVRWG